MPVDIGEEPAEYFCPTHAFDNGYCKGCGRFFGGIESFDFGSGYCDDCQNEIDRNDELDDELDDDDFEGLYSPEDDY